MDNLALLYDTLVLFRVVLGAFMVYCQKNYPKNNKNKKIVDKIKLRLYNKSIKIIGVYYARVL